MDTDINAIYEGLAEAAAAIPKLNALPYAPDAPTPPMFFPVEVEGQYDTDFAGGVGLMVTGRLIVSRATDKHGQRELNVYLAPQGERSLKRALEASRHSANGALGGRCADLHVVRFGNYGLFDFGATNTTKFYGADVVVRVIT